MARNHRVAVLAFTPFPAFELAVPCEVFGIDRRDDGVPRYDVRIVAGSPTPLRARDVPFTIDTPFGMDTLGWADTIVIPGFYASDTAPTEAIEALQQAHARGARIASVCSGAYLLAHAGLLDGRRATTHWKYARDLAERFPAIEVDASVLYVADGNVFTSAGTAAGIDLCLHLLRLDHGAEVANIVARRMVVPPHRDGGQAQYVETPMLTSAPQDHGDLSGTLLWATRHLDREITVAELARRADMSPRTFARRFREVTGTTPLRWLLSQRVVLAQRLLETTTLSIDQIATRCGLGTAANLRIHFSRAIGTTPQAYRQMFRRAG